MSVQCHLGWSLLYADGLLLVSGWLTHYLYKFCNQPFEASVLVKVLECNAWKHDQPVVNERAGLLNYSHRAEWPKSTTSLETSAASIDSHGKARSDT
jgi:hypothetical protein